MVKRRSARLYAKKLDKMQRMCDALAEQGELNTPGSVNQFTQSSNAKQIAEISQQLQEASATGRFDSTFQIQESTSFHSYKWTIEDYQIRKLFEDELVTQFSFTESKWSLALKQEDLILKNLDDFPNSFVFGELILTGAMGIISHPFSHNFEKMHAMVVKIPELCNDNFVPSDTLTIFCSLNEIRTVVQRNEKLQKICPSMFVAPLLDIPSFYDVEFFVKRAKFQAHKTMFKLRCPKFWEEMNTVLQGDEEEISCISIKHIQPVVFRAFLRYIYTDKVYLELSTSQLIGVANEYDISRMKTKCEKVMIEALNLNNAIYYFTCARTANAQQLMEKATRLILSNLHLIPAEELKINFFPFMNNVQQDDSLAVTLLSSKQYKVVQKTLRWDFFIGNRLSQVHSELNIENISLRFSYETDNLGNVLLKVEPKAEDRLWINLEVAVRNEMEMSFYEKTSRTFSPSTPTNFLFDKIIQDLGEVKRSFSVFCYVIIYRNVEPQQSPKSDDYECDPSHDLCRDLKCLYETTVNSDLMIMTEQKTLKVHKFILGPNIKVINDMLENSWQEMRTIDIIEAKKIPIETLNAIVEFFYTGEISNSAAITVQFMQACYDLDVNPKLKEVCQKVLGTRINVSNIMQMFNVSVRYKADLLMSRCLDFMRRNDISIGDLVNNASPSDVNQKNLFIEENIYKIISADRASASK